MIEKDAERLLVEVAEEIEAAAFGLSSWENVAHRLSDGLPGSVCVLLSEDQIHKRVQRLDYTNIETARIAEYVTYYAFRNPWFEAWKKVPDGLCVVSERDYPVTSILDTEYYNDFVRRIENFDAVTGVSIDNDPANTFRMMIHYSVAQAERYDPWAEWILSRLKGVLRRTANGMTCLYAETDRQITHAALVNRVDEIAIVVDNRMKVLGGNPDAIAAFHQSTVFYEKHGRLGFRDQAMADAVAIAVKSIVASPASDVSSMVVTVESGRWVLFFSLIAQSRASHLVSSRPFVLIQARNLMTSPALRPLVGFARMFALTQAEELFCRHLLAGLTVREIAVVTGVTFETARSRLRTIFQKTDAHRQAELISLLLRSAGP